MEQAYENKGARYTEVLKALHATLKPESYLEIGTRRGATLDLASCLSICVDPVFQLRGPAAASRPATMLFQMTSDRFFQRYSPAALAGQPIELAFIDGLHEFETTLRDFVNVEKNCRKNSVITLHDCVPFDSGITSRTPNDGAWTGDVWKVVPILRKHRPDIDVFVFDAAKTGLVCCTNLDPCSRILQERYGEICAEWRDVALADHGFGAFIDGLGVLSTSALERPEDIRRYFWL